MVRFSLKHGVVTLIVFALICVVSFFVVHYEYTGSFMPRVFDRVSQSFSEDYELFHTTHGFHVFGDGVVESYNDDPWFVVRVDPSVASNLLHIYISDLRHEGEAIESTLAEIFYAREGEHFHWNRMVLFELENGVNVVELPYDNYVMLRLDLAVIPYVSMRVEGVMFANFHELSVGFFVSWTVVSVLIMLCITLFVLTCVLIKKHKGMTREKTCNATIIVIDKLKFIYANLVLVYIHKVAVWFVVTAVTCLLCFFIMHFEFTDSVFPRIMNRESQYFSQEAAYHILTGFELLEDGMIKSYYARPNITLHLDPSMQGNKLFISISSLKRGEQEIESTSAQIYFALQGEHFSGWNSVRTELKNGVNIVRIPYAGYARLRLDLTNETNIVMSVDGVTFANYYVLLSSFWISMLISFIAIMIGVFILIFYDFGVNKETNNNQIIKIKDNLMLIIASILMPSILLLDLYNRNRIRNHIEFSHVMIWVVIFLFASLVLLRISHLLVRSLKGSFILLLIFWLLFWFFEVIYNAMFGNCADVISRMVLLSFFSLIWVIVSCYINRYRFYVEKMSVVLKTLALCLCAFFVMNIIPGIVHEIALITSESSDNQSMIKTTFNVENNTPSPDIYWFHMDGMIDFEVVRAFFAWDPQESRNELNDRGFIIYEGAALHTGITLLAMPALFSPAFYDNIYGEILSNFECCLAHERMVGVSSTLSEHGLSLHTDIQQYHEILNAFTLAGYDVGLMVLSWASVIGQSQHDWMYILDRDDRPLMFANESVSNFWTEITQSNLGQLLALTTPLSLFFSQEPLQSSYVKAVQIPDHFDLMPYYESVEERRLYRKLIDSFSLPSPKFVLTSFDFTHVSHWRLYAEHLNEGEPEFYRYLMAHEDALRIAINAIDLVLNENPNAVIVMQSDHGIHNTGTHHELAAAGFTHEEILQLQDYVFSAVRIPPQYGGLDAPLAPLNISRELVNRFVGENYTLLPCCHGGGLTVSVCQGYNVDYSTK